MDLIKRILVNVIDFIQAIIYQVTGVTILIAGIILTREIIEIIQDRSPMVELVQSIFIILMMIVLLYWSIWFILRPGMIRRERNLWREAIEKEKSKE